MAYYKNIVGGGGGASAPKKFDPTALASMGFDMILGTLVGISEGKKQRELQEKIARMSLKQQKELEENLVNAQSQLERQRIMYQTFAVIENSKLVDARKNKQLTLLSILGGGTLLLVGMAIFYKRK
jgi:hypothetical protein